MIAAQSGEHREDAPRCCVAAAPVPAVELDLKSIAIPEEAGHYPLVNGVEAERLDINPKNVASLRNCRHPKHAWNQTHVRKGSEIASEIL